MPVAISIKVDQGSIRDLLARVSRMEAAVQRAVQATVERYADLIAREAKGLAPVDTGDLRSTIRVDLERLAASVIAGGQAGASGRMVDYAHVPELGRRDQPNYPVQPYLRPAFERHAPAFLRALEDTISGAVRRHAA